MIVQFRNEKVGKIMASYRSPLTVTLWPSSFLKKYGPMIPPSAHKARTKQSVFLDVTVFRHTLWISFTPNAAVLFVDVAIQPEVRFIAKQKLAYEEIDHYFRNKIAQFESVVQA
ncbi:hypothetical protein TNCV_729841 [Trichonephila clavipes]|nr:hypothetical protein TNCV_729841 [Trichonephila clavipes]